ncbi:nucleotide sugar dehydrogenase [Haloarcula japonica]|uniref:UDP-N-acetyl-D-mannosamine dehydrogenase n=1 Tax=Haloarcula japonica (strain ATCC 49778 / DSM 6131 / JCM 7785 / NBRC 101032 / NCIMB 13157 / TR-1) TaxID=1227453 RepID=M0L6Y9_HALJT|nr:nucleotide sugar dehydrogenase [Haloarcula japonica]EMA27730.1 UDP-glucose 6-dehydrogenase [Haloarcula japonica DSM 6131]
MTICVHGLGYIGLATAAHFANNGTEVIGFDVDEDVIEHLSEGEPTVSEPDFESYVQDALEGNLALSRQPRPADVHVICVPTPYNEMNGEADLTYVKDAGRNVAGVLRPGDTVVLESTVPPETTTGVLAPILSRGGLDVGDDVALGYTPETVMPGNTLSELRTNDRIVGGVDEASVSAIETLYEPLTSGEIHVAADPTTAEFVKLAQNAKRNVSIAYANTLALLAENYGVDVRSAISLANNHPRVDILNPGPGVGGHCLPVDPHFLSDGTGATELLDVASQVNDRMPEHVIRMLEDAVGTLHGKTVAVLGITYKGNVSDTRNSPGLEVANLLGDVTTEARTAVDGGWGESSVTIHDPRATDSRLQLVSLEAAIDGAYAVIFGAAHEEFADLDPEAIGSKMSGRTVVDPVDVIDAERWTDYGFDVRTI